MLTIAHLCIDFMLLTSVGFVLPKQLITTDAVSYMIDRFSMKQTPSLALHYRFEFADRSLAARQCAALVAVKPQELLCESIQLRCTKRVVS
jgi:hypothetical protein